MFPMFPLFPGPGGLFRDLGVRAAQVTNGSSGVRVRRRRADGLLATQGQLRQRHGLMREALRGQHGEGMTWRAETSANVSDETQPPEEETPPPLTVDVAVKRHHARPFRTAEGGVM